MLALAQAAFYKHRSGAACCALGQVKTCPYKTRRPASAPAAHCMGGQLRSARRTANYSRAAKLHLQV